MINGTSCSSVLNRPSGREELESGAGELGIRASVFRLCSPPPGLDGVETVNRRRLPARAMKEGIETLDREPPRRDHGLVKYGCVRQLLKPIHD